MEETEKMKDVKDTLDFTKQSWRDDVVFIIEDKRIYASKCVLALYSPVFEKMFGSNFKEKEQTEVELPDKKAEDFLEFLRCIYPTSKYPVTKKNVRQVLPLAHEYQVTELIEVCRDIIVESAACAEEGSPSPDLVESYAVVSTYGLKEQESLFVNEIVRQGNLEMITAEAEDLLTRDTLVEFQKSIILEQSELLRNVTTKFVKLCVQTRNNTTGYLRTIGKARGATIEFTIDDVFKLDCKKKVCSKAVMLWDVSFFLSASVSQITERGQNDKYLSIYLECKFPDNDAGWSCKVDGDIIVEDTFTGSGRLVISKSLSGCNLTSRTQEYGYRNFEKLSRFLSIVSETEGDVDQYSCKVVAYVLAQMPEKVSENITI